MFHQDLCHADLRLLEEIVGKMRVPCRLRRDGGNNPRVTLSEGVDREAGEHIEVACPITGYQIYSLSPFDLERKTFVRMKKGGSFAVLQVHGSSKIVLA
jgi:hypothetical protein